jgi:hypothetical protein
MRRWIWIALALACGCSVVNDPAMHQPEPIPPADVCEVFAEVICQAQVDCCPTGGSDTCRGLTIALCDAFFAPFVDDTRNGYDPELAGVYLNFARALASYCAPEYFYVLRAPDGLFAALRGTLPDAAVCVDEASQPLPFACSNDEQTCLRNERGGFTCAARSASEGPCIDTYTASCAPGHYCEVRPLLGNRCLELRAPGVNCTGHHECASYACVDGTCLDPADATRVRQAYCSAGL